MRNHITEVDAYVNHLWPNHSACTVCDFL